MTLAIIEPQLPVYSFVKVTTFLDALRLNGRLKGNP